MLIIVQMFHILQSIPHYVHTHNVIYQYIDKFIKNILLLDFLGIIPIVKAKHSLFLSLSPPLFYSFYGAGDQTQTLFLWCRGFTPPALQWLIFVAIFQEVIQNSVATTLQGLTIGEVKAFYSFHQL